MWTYKPKGRLCLPRQGPDPKQESYDSFIASLTCTRFLAWAQHNWDSMVDATIERWFETWPELAPARDFERETAKEYQDRKISSVANKIHLTLCQKIVIELLDYCLNHADGAEGWVSELERLRRRAGVSCIGLDRWLEFITSVEAVRAQMGLEYDGLDDHSWRAEMATALNNSDFESFTTYNREPLDGTPEDDYDRVEKYHLALGKPVGKWY
ncbi:hypothetical protein E1B28_003362 [Marasmius oreades]|uniref:Uncharacterized protein n=1 Tax=Marasmius oreades TaxID=181124 RepID=A0A9P7RLN0_9AGAR|nr:uncharacterized protein E1B28_003362 [Marasmius oreades]KAG7085824.1 hypothetical protein E1B28_003362 [Marasmius oreades]